jgi:hypothetical protein
MNDNPPSQIATLVRQQLEAVNATYRMGYLNGYQNGYEAGMREAMKIFDTIFPGTPRPEVPTVSPACICREYDGGALKIETTCKAPLHGTVPAADEPPTPGAA